MGEERDKRPGEAPGAGLGETRVSHGPNVRATLPLGARSAGAGAGAAGHAIDEATEDTLLAIEVATSTAAGRTIHTQAGSADDTQRWVVDDPLAADADETLRWVVDDPRAMESDDTQLLVVDDTRSLESDDTELLAVGRAARWTVEELADERRGPAAASGQIGETGGGAGLRGAMTRVSVGRFARSNDETRLRSASGFVDEPPDEEPAVAAGGRIGRFVVLRELGRGAMGVVFAAYDEELDRKVAIKLLHAGDGEQASHGRAMLLREAQAMAKLSHPNVVAVHEVGVIGGAVFVAMEYVAGVDLHQWLTSERRPWRDAVAVLRQAGAGLVAAHREGLVHRDFKPSNVMVGEDGRVRVADFGLAARRSAGTAGPSGLVRVAGALSETLTGEGALIGTPLYMAPELLRMAPATALSDQYAFCVALYEALYGARPFDADTLDQLTEVVEQRPLPATPPRTDVPAWLYAAVVRGLAKRPEARWPSLAELVDLLGRDPEAERRLRRRRALQIAGAIAATAAIVALVVIAYGAARAYMAERQAEGRLAALREQMAELRGRGDIDEAGRLLQTFVTLPEHRGTVVIARAYLEWAAAQEDPSAAIDAYASAYIAARTPADGRVALRGLIDRLSARGQVQEAAAALAVFEGLAPDDAAAPELQAVRLASALARRDLQAARGALVAGDPDGWSPVLGDLSRVTDVPRGWFGGGQPNLTRVDFDGDGRDEVVAWGTGEPLRVYRADVGFELLRTIDVGPARRVRAVRPIVAGRPLLVASHATSEPQKFEMRVLEVADDGSLRTIDAWLDSVAFTPMTVDFDGDGRRELYIGTEAYARRFWRIEAGADGAWSRRPAHAPTDAVGSDLGGLVAADFEGDGRSEIVVAAGPWSAYDVRVYKPTAAGALDQVARKAFGSFEAEAMVTLRAGERELVAFSKSDEQIAANRFPPDRPLGEPAGVYVIDLQGGAIEVVGHVPEQPVHGLTRKLVRVFAADLDGDEFDELVIDMPEEGMMLARVRAGQPLRPISVAGVRPLVAADLDGDGDDELVVGVLGEPERVLVLGSGEGVLAPLPAVEAVARGVPPGIADPPIAEAWRRAEQLVAIGLPRRTADELAAIARLAGPVAPDMLLRTAELYATVGEDARAAELFVAAATRPDIMGAALGGAAQARRRRGEFAEAEALTRRRLAVVGEDARAEVSAELARLTEATAARPELALTFTGPLDERWRVRDPVAVRRGLGRGELSVWASPTRVVAELPIVWDGGPAALEVELEAGLVEWGTEIAVEVSGLADRRWLGVDVGGYGVTDAPRTMVTVNDRVDRGQEPMTAPRIRGRIAVFPALDMAIRELEMDGKQARTVLPMGRPDEPVLPPPGPLRLRVTTRLIQPGLVANVGIRSIRLTGFTAGEAGEAADEAARLLVEGEFAGAAAALQSAAPDSERALWRIDALLGLGQVEAATKGMAAVLAAAPAGGPVERALYQRLRRPDPVARLAARGAYGSRLVEVMLMPGTRPTIRAIDVEALLANLPAAPASARPEDPEALHRLVLVDYARGLAHEQAGQWTAAQAAFAAAFTRIGERTFPQREPLRAQVMVRQLAVAVAMADRETALRLVRARVADSATPYLALERMQSDTALFELLGAEVWATLLAETRAVRR